MVVGHKGMKGMDQLEIKQLIEGAIDMHLHGSPDITERKLSDIGLARAAREAHMAGIMLKSHYGLTAARATLVCECVPGINVFGGIVLNNMVGGFNPEAVETALQLGAKEVWMPTITAENHLRCSHQDISKAVKITDAYGKIIPEIYPILEMIAENDVILGTGHLSIEESLKIISLAKEKGVKKILVTHPEWEFTKMPVAIQKELASQGVYFERCYYAAHSSQQLPIGEVAEQIKQVGAETTVMSTDFGQIFNELPVTGIQHYVADMISCGIPASDIEVMIKNNPKYLLSV